MHTHVYTVCMRALHACLHMYLSAYISILVSLSICMFTSESLFVCLFIFLSISVCLSIHMSLSVVYRYIQYLCLSPTSLSLSVCLPICLCISVCPSTYFSPSPFPVVSFITEHRNPKMILTFDAYILIHILSIFIYIGSM